MPYIDVVTPPGVLTVLLSNGTSRQYPMVVSLHYWKGETIKLAKIETDIHILKLIYKTSQ